MRVFFRMTLGRRRGGAWERTVVACCPPLLVCSPAVPPPRHDRLQRAPCSSPHRGGYRNSGFLCAGNGIPDSEAASNRLQESGLGFDVGPTKHRCRDVLFLFIFLPHPAHTPTPPQPPPPPRPDRRLSLPGVRAEIVGDLKRDLAHSLGVATKAMRREHGCTSVFSAGLIGISKTLRDDVLVFYSVYYTPPRVNKKRINKK
jgi:hypothetical protein